MLRSARVFLLCCLPVVGLAQQAATAPSAEVARLHEVFAHPPDDCKIMMRWWWFGPSATKPELKRELEQMKAAGIGGVEIATLYPLALDEPQSGFHNYAFASDEHIDNLRFAAEQARRLGMRVDITLGSGWPFGGRAIPVTQAAGKLRVERVNVAPGSASAPVPAMEAGEKLLAAFMVPGADRPLDYRQVHQLPMPVGPRVEIPGASDSERTVVFFVSSRTGMMVKRAAVGATGFVLDHYDSVAIRNHLENIGDRLLSAFGDHPPYAVFSDSLEDYGSDWTPALLQEFERRRGYDLTPMLPALVGDIGPETAAVRHDWGRTLTELADENYLEPIHVWAHKHSTLFRSQTYGFPPVTLSSNRFEDLPEGEGKATLRMWRAFSDTRWAASAGHLFGHPVISSETWTWLHSPAFRATPLDMKAEADLHFLQGINQLVGHGWPYSPPEAGEPGWRMYAAGALNAHNPWWMVMPDLAAYLQRASFALRQGKPANDIAIFLPEDDVWASFKARSQGRKSATGEFDETGSNITMDESMPEFLGDQVVEQVLDAGFNFDFIDAGTIDTLGIPYKVLILPDVHRIDPATYEKIVKFANAGVIVIATRRLPDTAPGYREATAITARVKQISTSLFGGQMAKAHFVEDEGSLGAMLASTLNPDFAAEPATPDIGFIHRHLEYGDLYFVANTSNQEREIHAKFRAARRFGEQWDPFTGKTEGLPDPKRIVLDLQPYESRLIYFSDVPLSPVERDFKVQSRIDISRDWRITIGNTTVRLESLGSWTDVERLRYFSGVVSYDKTISIDESALQPGRSVFLDFGDGTPVALPEPLLRFNMRAYLESPVREAARVYVNDHPAGYVWHPPFRLDIVKFLKPGANTIRILVGNTAINELAGADLPDYRLLYNRYGVEFVPQDMQNLKPLPSGILGTVSLIESRAER
ncbi:MAG TPA: glycosyl hydrolase [Terracidiphilus sp.]|jgi:hypothetical protein